MMKRTIAIIFLVLLMVGCTPTAPAVTSSGDPAHTTSAPASPEPDNPDPDAETYYALKAKLKHTIELAYAEEPRAPWGHFDEIRTIIEEMLKYRQSLDDFSESMDIDENGYMGSEEILPVFSNGKTNYRISQVYVHGYVDFRVYMYIQIYDEESIESQCVYVFQSQFAGIEYCGFRQDSNKIYLIIIEKQTYPEHISSYSLVNYEIVGKEVRNYNALREDFINDIWSAKEDIDSAVFYLGLAE